MSDPSGGGFFGGVGHAFSDAAGAVGDVGGALGKGVGAIASAAVSDPGRTLGFTLINPLVASADIGARAAGTISKEIAGVAAAPGGPSFDQVKAADQASVAVQLAAAREKERIRLRLQPGRDANILTSFRALGQPDFGSIVGAT